MSNVMTKHINNLSISWIVKRHIIFIKSMFELHYN